MNAPFTARVISLRLSVLDEHLLKQNNRPDLAGFSRFVLEFFYFGIKEARETKGVSVTLFDAENGSVSKY